MTEVSGACLTVEHHAHKARRQNVEAVFGVRLGPDDMTFARCNNRACVAAYHAEIQRNWRRKRDGR